MKTHCRFAPNAAENKELRGGGRADGGGVRSGKGRGAGACLLRGDRGSLTVEASLVMTGIILIIFSMIMLAMVLRSSTAAASDVRLEVQRQFADIIEEGIPGSYRSAASSKEDISLWPLGTVSYEEEASRLFYNLPQIMRVGRIFSQEEKWK